MKAKVRVCVCGHRDSYHVTPILDNLYGQAAWINEGQKYGERWCKSMECKCMNFRPKPQRKKK